MERQRFDATSTLRPRRPTRKIKELELEMQEQAVRGAPNPVVRPEKIKTPNPDCIPKGTMKELKIWVHHWVLARIPEQHQHLVNDVDKGDIGGLSIYSLRLWVGGARPTAVGTARSSRPGCPSFRLISRRPTSWRINGYWISMSTSIPPRALIVMAPTRCPVVDVLEAHMPK
jgi:hypothetical protein